MKSNATCVPGFGDGIRAALDEMSLRFAELRFTEYDQPARLHALAPDMVPNHQHERKLIGQCRHDIPYPSLQDVARSALG